MSPTVSGMVSSTTFCICRTILTGNWELFIPNESNLWCKISNFQLNHSMLIWPLIFKSRYSLIHLDWVLVNWLLDVMHYRCRSLVKTISWARLFSSQWVRRRKDMTLQSHNQGVGPGFFCQPCIEPFSVWVSSTVKKILSQTLFNVVFLLHSSICYVLFLWIATRQGLSCSFNKFGIIVSITIHEIVLMYCKNFLGFFFQSGDCRRVI